jgi:polyhydroxybutyrate depolymerase
MILDDPHPSQPVAVIEIHGTADGEVPHDGGRTAGGTTQRSPATPSVTERWTELDGCQAPAASQLQGPVTTLTWRGCAAGTAVKLVAIDGGGHTWFSQGPGPVNGAVDATTELWSFLGPVHRRA